MATSANVVEYRIKKGDEVVGNHRQHLYCKNKMDELLKFEPLSEHTITPYGYDEEEGYWESKTQNLEEYLKKNVHFNKKVKEHFSK